MFHITLVLMVFILSDEIEVEREGKIIKDWCDILVNGTGFLNNWKCWFVMIERKCPN